MRKCQNEIINTSSFIPSAAADEFRSETECENGTDHGIYGGTFCRTSLLRRLCGKRRAFAKPFFRHFPESGRMFPHAFLQYDPSGSCPDFSAGRLFGRRDFASGGILYRSLFLPLFPETSRDVAGRVPEKPVLQRETGFLSGLAKRFSGIRQF